MDELPSRIPSDALATSPSPLRWIVETIDGGSVLIALPGTRAPDLILSPAAEGLYHIYVGLYSYDGQPSEVGVRVGDLGPFKHLHLEDGEIDSREVLFGRVDITGRDVVLRHPVEKRSCVSHVRLAPLTGNEPEKESRSVNPRRP